MIDKNESLLPIVVFDQNDDWSSILKMCSDHLDKPGLERLESALSRHARCVAIEHHYIDKDYRNTFSHFHSKRFSTPNSRCVRLHFFSKAITHNDLKDSEIVQPCYLGYSVIRPVRPNCIGRTLIDFKNYIGSNAYVCSCQESVNLHGTELAVEGFPFISQHVDATVCAQSALWMLVRYFSNRYSVYPETYPFQLTQLSKDYSIGRIYPSSGLSMWQLGESLRQLGFAPLIYDRQTFKGNFDRLLYTYVESGIPVIAGVPNHVVAVLGHLSDYSLCKIYEDKNYKKPGFSSDICSGWIISDDNYAPCTKMYRSKDFGSSKFVFSSVDSFIAPLAEKIFLSAENFEQLVLKLLENSDMGVNKLSLILSKTKLVLRIYLTTVKSYKKKLGERDGMGNPKVELLYRQLPLPHFIWVCEFSDQEKYADGKVLGEVIWDATRNQHEATTGAIAIHYPEILLIDVGSALNVHSDIQRIPLTDSQPYPLYRSNLKEI